MSSEPPGSEDAPEDAPVSESPGNDIDKRSGDRMRARWRPSIVPIVGVLTVAGGVGVFLYVTHGSDSKQEHVTPALGLTCPSLQQAADAYDRGDRAAYNQAIDQAARVAEDTLQKSGEVFGEPERIALELSLQQHRPRRSTLDLLSAAQVACSGKAQRG
jgi:hypothetical protein